MGVFDDYFAAPREDHVDETSDTDKYPAVDTAVEAGSSVGGVSVHPVEAYGNADLVQVVITRLEELQASEERCPEFAQAICFLKDARSSLMEKMDG